MTSEDWFNESLKDYEDKLTAIKANYDEAKVLLDNMVDRLKEERDNTAKMIEKYQRYPTIQSDIVEMNVGGHFFSTLRATITKKVKKPKSSTGKDEYYDSNIIEAILNGFIEPTKDKGEHLFIDRNPKLFGFILDYLRLANTQIRYELPFGIDYKELKNEAEYYNVDGLFDLIVMNSLNSNIMSPALTNYLIDMCEFSVNNKWTLIYSGKQDGFSASSFHARCDNQGDTLVVVLTDHGCIFGGFSRAKWDSSNQYKTDKDAFVFSLVNKEKKPQRFNIASGREQYAIYCNPQYGPTFGGGHDFFIASNCDTSDSGCNSNLGHCYRNERAPIGTVERARSLLGGGATFKVEEIEVFARKPTA